MHPLKSAALAGIAMFATSALATDPNIVFDVSPLPETVTSSRPSLETFAAYRITIANDSPYTAKSVKLKGQTTVVGSSESAPFVSANGAACQPIYTPPSSAVECVIGQLAGYASVTFSVTFAAPANGTRIEFASATFHQRADLGYYAPVIVSPVLVVHTQLVAPNPLQVATFLPEATGGTVFTGSNGGVALSGDVATTTVDVPRSATVAIDETPDPTPPICPGVPVCPPNVSQLTIPGTFDHLTITLRLDATVIPKRSKGSEGQRSGDHDDDERNTGGGGAGKKPSINKAKVYYQADPTPANPHPQPVEVLACSITGGPSPGTPCIASRTAYTKKNAPSPDFIGDWEFVIFAVDNGRYFI